MAQFFDVEAIERRARAAGLSIDELCRRAQIDRATWQRWKAGKTKPLLETWARLLAALPPESAGGARAKRDAAA